MAIDWNIGEVEYRNNPNTKSRVRPAPDSEIASGDISMTVPGEGFTIAEIMERALQGISLRTNDFPFFDQEDLDSIKDFPTDLTDLDATRQELEDLKVTIDEAIAEEAVAPPIVDPPESIET